MNKPLLSVVVPVYKVEHKYLEDCLASIDAQTFKDFELIIVDDGAPADTATYLDEYSSDKEYVLVIHKDNSGVADARNIGMEKCRGKYLTFIDSDDTVRSDNFEKVVTRAQEDDLDVLMWGLYRIFDKGQSEFSPYSEDIRVFDEARLREVQLKCLVGILPSFKSPATADAAGSACAKLYRLDFLRENNLKYIKGLKRAEDMLFNLMVLGKAKRVGYIKDFYYNYFQLDSSATYQYRENGIKVFTDTLTHMGQYLKDINADEEFLQVYYMRCMFFLLESMDMDYNNPNNPKGFWARRQDLAKAASTEPYREAVNRLKLWNPNLVIARKIPLLLIRFRLFGLLMIFYKVYGLIQK